MEEVALEPGPYRTAGLKDAGDTSKRLTADILTLFLAQDSRCVFLG